MANGAVGGLTGRLPSAATYKSAGRAESSRDVIAFHPPTDYPNGHTKSSGRQWSLRNPKRWLRNRRLNFNWLCRKGLALPVWYLIGKAKDLNNWYLNSTSTTTAGPSDDQDRNGGTFVEPYFSIPVLPPP